MALSAPDLNGGFAAQQPLPDFLFDEVFLAVCDPPHTQFGSDPSMFMRQADPLAYFRAQKLIQGAKFTVSRREVAYLEVADAGGGG